MVSSASAPAASDSAARCADQHLLLTCSGEILGTCMGMGGVLVLTGSGSQTADNKVGVGSRCDDDFANAYPDPEGEVNPEESSRGQHQRKTSVEPVSIA